MTYGETDPSGLSSTWAFYLLAPRAGLGHYGRNVILPASPPLRIPGAAHSVGLFLPIRSAESSLRVLQGGKLANKKAHAFGMGPFVCWLPGQDPAPSGTIPPHAGLIPPGAGLLPVEDCRNRPIPRLLMVASNFIASPRSGHSVDQRSFQGPRNLLVVFENW